MLHSPCKYFLYWNLSLQNEIKTQTKGYKRLKGAVIPQCWRGGRRRSSSCRASTRCRGRGCIRTAAARARTRSGGRSSAGSAGRSSGTSQTPAVTLLTTSHISYLIPPLLSSGLREILRYPERAHTRLFSCELNVCLNTVSRYKKFTIKLGRLFVK